jgi:hypothetical protein
MTSVRLWRAIFGGATYGVASMWGWRGALFTFLLCLYMVTLFESREVE